MDAKLEEFYKWWKTFNIHLIDFHSDPMLDRMTPVRPNKEIPNGIYFTIRCGLGGIYTDLNEMKDGDWLMRALDGSYTIAYRKLTNDEQTQYDYFIEQNKKH